MFFFRHWLSGAHFISLTKKIIAKNHHSYKLSIQMDLSSTYFHKLYTKHSKCFRKIHTQVSSDERFFANVTHWILQKIFSTNHKYYPQIRRNLGELSNAKKLCCNRLSRIINYLSSIVIKDIELRTGSPEPHIVRCGPFFVYVIYWRLQRSFVRETSTNTIPVILKSLSIFKIFVDSKYWLLKRGAHFMVINHFACFACYCSVVL